MYVEHAAQTQTQRGPQSGWRASQAAACSMQTRRCSQHEQACDAHMHYHPARRSVARAFPAPPALPRLSLIASLCVCLPACCCRCLRGDRCWIGTGCCLFVAVAAVAAALLLRRSPSAAACRARRALLLASTSLSPHCARDWILAACSSSLLLLLPSLLLRVLPLIQCGSLLEEGVVSAHPRSRRRLTADPTHDSRSWRMQGSHQHHQSRQATIRRPMMAADAPRQLLGTPPRHSATRDDRDLTPVSSFFVVVFPGMM